MSGFFQHDCSDSSKEKGQFMRELEEAEISGTHMKGKCKDSVKSKIWNESGWIA